MLIGNLTRDPNLRYTPSGAAVCSFGLATNRSWTTDGGAKEERVDFHNVVSWAKLAEICGQILHKGDKVYVEGRVQTRDWKTDSGDERKVTEVVIDNMILLHSLRGRGNYSDNSQMGDDSRSDDKASGTTQAATDDKADDTTDKKVEKAEKETEVAEEVASDDIPF